MIKNILSVLVLLFINLCIFLVGKTYFSDQQTKKIKKNRETISQTIKNNTSELPVLTNDTNNGIHTGEYDALNFWLEIHNNNDAYLSMISASAKNWFANETGDYTDNDLDVSKLWGTANGYCQHSTEDGGGTSGG